MSNDLAVIKPYHCLSQSITAERPQSSVKSPQRLYLNVSKRWSANKWTAGHNSCIALISRKTIRPPRKSPKQHKQDCPSIAHLTSLCGFVLTGILLPKFVEHPIHVFANRRNPFCNLVHAYPFDSPSRCNIVENEWFPVEHLSLLCSSLDKVTAQEIPTFTL